MTKIRVSYWIPGNSRENAVRAHWIADNGRKKRERKNSYANIRLISCHTLRCMLFLIITNTTEINAEMLNSLISTKRK